MKPLVAIFITLIIVSCSSIKIPKDAKQEDYFFVSEGKDFNQSEWVVFLPGTSGLTIFNDSTHYIKIAQKLNELNYNVILVDYKKAYKASGRKVKETTGQKINWVLEEAIIWANKKYDLKNSKFKVVGWSLAGEGLCLLANDSAALNRLDIESLAMYYPSNQAKVKVVSQIPILIQVGTSDQITPSTELKRNYKHNSNTHIVELENAYHGFDIESLNQGKEFRFPPVIGKKYLMKYDSLATELSFRNLINFLNTN